MPKKLVITKKMPRIIFLILFIRQRLISATKTAWIPLHATISGIMMTMIRMVRVMLRMNHSANYSAIVTNIKPSNLAVFKEQHMK